MAVATESLKARLRKVQLPVERRLSELLEGDYSSLRLGNGFEFSHMKEYVEGDDTRRINWKALARDPSHPRVNVMNPDSSVVGWVVADCGPDMNFGSDPVRKARKSDVSLETAAAFGHLLTQRGNRFGAILVGNQGIETVKPGQRRQQVSVVAGKQYLIDAPDGAETDLAAGLRRFRLLQKRRGVCVVISDFRSSGWENELKLISKRHTLYLVQVVDPLELKLDGDVGVNNLRTPSTAHRSRIDVTAKVAERYTELARERQKQIRLALLSYGARFIELHTDSDWLKDLILSLKQPKRRTYVRN